MKRTCDSVGLTTDLYGCVVELKEVPPQNILQWLALAFFGAATALSVADEQVLSLP